MAIGTPYAAGADVTAVGASSTDTFTTNTNVAATDTLFLFIEVRLNVGSTINSITDSNSLGLTYDITTAANAGGQNGTCFQVRAYASVQIPSGTVFTITYNNSPARHHVAGLGVPGVANATPDANHKGSADGSGGTPTVSTAGSTPAAGDLALGQWAHVGSGANGDSATPTASFTEYADTAVVSATPFLHGYDEYQVLGSGGTITSAPTFASNVGGWIGQIVVYQPAAGGPFTVTANRADESDTAFAIRASKSKAIGLAAETDAAFAIRPSHVRAPGLASESDTAFAIVASKRRLVGLAPESDTAFSIAASKSGGGPHILSVGLALETDTAFPITRPQPVVAAPVTPAGTVWRPMRMPGSGSVDSWNRPRGLPDRRRW